MNSPKIILKIPQQAYKMAVDNDLKKELDFYYLIKGIRIDGFFKRGTVIPQISSYTKLSTSCIKKNLAKLKDVGFVRGTAGNYQLISYDDLWDKLGMDRREKNSKRFKNKILRCKTKNFTLEMWFNEIKENFSQQKYKIVAKHTAEQTGDTDGARRTPNALIKKLSKGVEKNINLFRTFQVRKLRKNLDYPHTNYEVTLTCLGVANLFGFNSWEKGHQIERMLEKAGYINIERRSPIYLCNNNHQAILIPNSIANTSFVSSCERFIYKFMPNLITIND